MSPGGLLSGAFAFAAGCGSSSSSGSGSGSGSASSSGSNAPNPKAPETSPAGDIPDNQAYVAYSPPGSGVSVRVPEGWSRSTASGATTFTDKLNSIAIETAPAKAATTAAAARRTDLPKLAQSVTGFKPGAVTTVQRKAGPAVRLTYLGTAKADPVTGKTRTNAVERYLFFHNGKALTLTLSGPKGADNVDPWRIVTDSVRWTA